MLTVVIPVWDRHVAFLPRCLDSIANERVPVELLVIDNASHEPIDAPSNSRLVTLAVRQSIGAARNAALAQVNTPFVVFADADDELAAGSVARSLELLRRDPDAPGVLGRSIVDEHGRLQRRGRTPRASFLLVSRLAPRLAPLFWLKAFQCSITSTVLRTSAVRDAGGFANADLGEDWRLAARLARRGRFICLTDPVRIYHRHDQAARLVAGHRPNGQALRRMICTDCLSDSAATRLQRLVASLVARRSARNFD